MWGNRGNGILHLSRDGVWCLSGRKFFFLPRKQIIASSEGLAVTAVTRVTPRVFLLPKHWEFKIRDSTALARGTTHCSMKKKSYLCTQKMRYLDVLAN